MTISIKHDFVAFTRRIVCANLKTALRAHNRHYIFVPESAMGEGFKDALQSAGVQQFKTPKGRILKLAYDYRMKRAVIVIK